MVIWMGDSSQSYACSRDLGQFDLGLLASLSDGLYNVIDGGLYSHTNVVRGFRSAFADDFARGADNGRATIGPPPVYA